METNMKHYLLALSIGTAFLVGCQSPQKQNLIDSNFAFAEQQLKYAFPKIDEARANESQESKEKRIAKQWGELTNPRNTEPDGSLRLVPSKDWTSGFFPGELWYVYEYTHDPFWKEKAEKHTEMLEREKKNGTTHDMGFKMYCSYGNGYRLTGNPTYKDILIESARTLITRYKPNVGCLRSWDHHADQWECPVIIDNMLNLELLFWASRETNDSTFYNIAVNHARTTMKNQMQIIDISTLEFHISTTPNDTQSSKITRIYHDRIRSIDGNGILCQFFESYLLHINIIYNTFHFGCQIQLHISCNHSHIFRLFKLLWKINQRIVQNDLQCISHNSHFQIFIYFL